MDETTRAQSPIFTKTFDLIVWLMDRTEKFPKVERFRLARRIEDTAFTFHETLIRATRTRQPRTVLLQADLELDKLRFYIRMAHARKRLTPQQYHFAADALVEIGRLLGGWLKTISLT
ncbi:MAG: diversity-generating retroelement protein Avd [Chloroflexi bacterium]|nr:diversity-generating retroelement protein Avd [Chloroflexota bacterium]